MQALLLRALNRVIDEGQHGRARFRRLESGDQFSRFLRVQNHQIPGVLDSAKLSYKRGNLADVGAALLVLTDDAHDATAIRTACFAQRMDERQRHFLLLQIDPDWFSDIGNAEVEEVIPDLKC